MTYHALLGTAAVIAAGLIPATTPPRNTWHSRLVSIESAARTVLITAAIMLLRGLMRWEMVPPSLVAGCVVSILVSWAQAARSSRK